MAYSETPKNKATPQHSPHNDKNEDYRFKIIAPNPKGAFESIIAITDDTDDFFKDRGNERSSDIPTSQVDTIPPENISLHLPKPEHRRRESYDITIFHINDLHHQLLNHSREFSPLARMGSVVSEERSVIGEKDVLFLSAGDDHIGSIYDALASRRGTKTTSMSPVYRCLSALGLDAATLGNHDFDLDIEVLRNAIETDAAFPVLSANIEVPEKNYFSALLAVLNYSKLTLGIIGLSTLEEMHLREDREKGIFFFNPEEKAGKMMKILEEYADFVIVLSHLGYNTAGSAHTVEYDDNKLAHYLAEKTSVPVIIIGGHTHTAIDHSTEQNVTKNIPIFQAGSHGINLGRIDIKLDISGNKGFTWKSKLLKTENLPEDFNFENPFLQNHLLPLEQELSVFLDETITTVHTDNTADSVSTEEDRLTGECAVADFIADTLAETSSKIIKESIDPNTAPVLFRTIDKGRVIAASDGPGINGGFENGQKVTVKNWYEMLPYPDTLFYALITEKELTDIVLSNAERIIPVELLSSRGGCIQPHDWSHIARGFLHFSSRLRYDLAMEVAGDAIENNLWNKTSSSLEKESIKIKVRGITLYGDKEILPGKRKTTDNDSTRSHGGNLIPPEDKPVLFLVNSHTAMGFQGWGSDRQPIFYRFGAFDMTSLPFSDTGIPIRNMLIDHCREKSLIEIKKDGRLFTVRVHT